MKSTTMTYSVHFRIKKDQVTLNLNIFLPIIIFQSSNKKGPCKTLKNHEKWRKSCSNCLFNPALLCCFWMPIWKFYNWSITKDEENAHLLFVFLVLCAIFWEVRIVLFLREKLQGYKYFRNKKYWNGFRWQLRWRYTKKSSLQIISIKLTFLKVEENKGGFKNLI